MSRVGQGVLTGIDRVELAYLDRFVRAGNGTWLVIRAARRWIFVAPEKALRFADQLRHALTVGSGQAHARRRLIFSAWRMSACSVSRVNPDFRKLARLPDDLVYVNVGHSNLDADLLHGLKSGSSRRVVVMLHDAIPLDHPDWQREGSTQGFRTKLVAVARYADVVLTVSEFSKQRLDHYFGQLGSAKPVSVARPGIDVAAGTRCDRGERVGFVALGTLEPRKNIGFLLDLWAHLAEGGHDIDLHLIGKRGWKNEDLFQRLDRRPANVIEHGALGDEAVFDLLLKSHGLLFPSLAEGFGLPLAEAAASGVPVLCHDLPPIREFMGNYPVYLQTGDLYEWSKAVLDLVNPKETVPGADIPREDWRPPSWDAHFGIVSSKL